MLLKDTNMVDEDSFVLFFCLRKIEDAKEDIAREHP